METLMRTRKQDISGVEPGCPVCSRSRPGDVCARGAV